MGKALGKPLRWWWSAGGADPPSRAVPHARLWKQTTAALVSLLERESLTTPSCRPFELLAGCPKRPERLRRTSDNRPKNSVQALETEKSAMKNGSWQR